MRPFLLVMQPNGTLTPFPRQMTTNIAGESASFTLSQASAFFLYGAVNHDHGMKVATLTPLSDPSKAKTTLLNDLSSALDFKQILYWESDLDRDQNYTVRITQVGGTAFSFSSLDITDGFVRYFLRISRVGF